MAIQEISVHELKQMLSRGADFQLIDVRESAEYQNGYIQQSVHIPLEVLPSQHHQLSRKKPVVVYCHHGMQSALAIEYLTKTHGFDNLYALRGGLHAWATEIDQALLWY